jgi:hypothetical protein
MHVLMLVKIAVLAAMLLSVPAVSGASPAAKGSSVAPGKRASAPKPWKRADGQWFIGRGRNHTAISPQRAGGLMRSLRKANGVARGTSTKAEGSPGRRSGRAPGRQGFFSKPLDECDFSTVYRSRDGRWVRKEMRPSIHDERPVSLRERAVMARRTVRGSELLRGAGFPVPYTYLPKGEQGVIVQRFAKGIQFVDLPESIQFVAENNGKALARKADRFYRKLGVRNSHIDGASPT